MSEETTSECHHHPFSSLPSNYPVILSILGTGDTVGLRSLLELLLSLSRWIGTLDQELAFL
jgi:hypothetical protein